MLLYAFWAKFLIGIKLCGSVDFIPPDVVPLPFAVFLLIRLEGQDRPG